MIELSMFLTRSNLSLILLEKKEWADEEEEWADEEEECARFAGDEIRKSRRNKCRQQIAVRKLNSRDCVENPN